MKPEHQKLKDKLDILLPSLNERQKRLLVGAEASQLGRGGLKLLSQLTGMSVNTVKRGILDYEAGGYGDGGKGPVREAGGG